MKRSLLVLGSLLCCAAVARANEQIVTLGDSLTFAYEAEFGFQVTVFNPSTFSFETYGDGFGPEVKNWIEILSDPAYRGDVFELGARETFSLFTGLGTETMFLRQQNNWAIPGSTASQLREFVSGSRTFLEIIGSDPDFAALALALELSGFDESLQFNVNDLQNQIENVAERFTFFVGGNDMRGVYGSLYNGTLTPAQTESFISGFVADSQAVVDQVLAWNPSLPVVIVAVPHIGITPEMRGKYPTDPIKTARVTAATREINRRLKLYADAHGLGFADVFGPTLRILDASHPFTIHGIPYLNSGSTTGALDYLWLNGPISKNFHPNTNLQAVIADAIIHAFNETYGDTIPLLTATEILGSLQGETAADIDMNFATWMDGFGIPGLGKNDDSDGDGLPAAIEFGLGLDPTYPDANFVKTRFTPSAIDLTYPIRLPNTVKVVVDAEISTDLANFTPISPRPMPAADGYAHASLSIIPGAKGFIRINSTFEE